MKVYKLSFKDKADWDAVKSTFLIADEDGNYPTQMTSTQRTEYGNVTVVELGYLEKTRYVAEHTDMDGNIIPEQSATYYDNYSVDVFSEHELTAW